MHEFGPNAPGAGSDDFERWMEATPEGYFVNLTGPHSGLLHRATCPHMKFGARVNLVSRRKWASNSRTELVDRAHLHGIVLRECSDCDF